MIRPAPSVCDCIQSGFEGSLFLLQSRNEVYSSGYEIVSVVFLCLLCCVDASAIGRSASYKYKRLGSELDAQTRTDPGIAMMGGGTDLDEAFRWLCGKGNGGDFLILRAHGKDDYNKYVNKLCQMNSVATLIIPNRKAAQEPRVAQIISKATVIFIAGGDQARYINFWKGTRNRARC